jgi:deoxycytidine triphosphate deaminase
VADAFLDPETYWREDKAWNPPKAYWDDPHPNVMGMLSSDMIVAYNRALGGKMISPFNADNLKPAAYELTLGPLYYINGERKTLDKDSPWLTLPKNSIVFVSMQERIVLPHYIAARFDLAIEFIYQGILLGTGPQVDPGFQGVLSCPLHNISDGEVNLRYGYPFAKIDFAKTSGLAFAHGIASLGAEDDLYAAARSGSLTGVGGAKIKLFNERNRWREPIFDNNYTGRRQVLSSLSGIDQHVQEFGGNIDEFEQEVSRFRRYGLGAGLAVVFAMVAVLVALSQLDRSYTDAKIDSVQVPPGQSAARLAHLEADIASLQSRLKRLGPTKPTAKKP